MAGIHFDITGDNSNFMRKLQEAENGIRAASRQIEESGTSIEALFNRMTRAAAVFGAGFTAKELISDIVKVRGEFQQLEVAFNTMLGSKEKANALMSQLVRTAAVTPFDLQGVANGAKQLLAYGAAAEDVNETLIRIGNIAAGLSQPLSDLVYLYGTTMTQGRLYTQDLNQFTGRGIPMIRELANVFGVAEGEVKGLVEAGKVGFPEVQKVIHNLTNEGGMFYNLMQEQSKTITGQISNIEDAIATMFNEIGQANEGIINDALSGVGYLVENWESVAIAIESAAIAYGTYKAATMTAAALQGAEQTLKVDTEIEGLRALLIVKEESKNADIAAAVASGQLTESKAAELVVLREELALKISTLEAENTLAEKEYANALLSLDAADNRLRSAQDAVDGIDDWIARAEDLGDTELANAYRMQLGEKSTELQSAAIARNSAQKALNDAATKQKTTSEALNTVTTQANTVANNVNSASMNIMKLAAIQLTSILKRLWASLMANPLLLVAGAFVGLGYAIYQVATAETAAEKATRKYNEALDEQQKKQDEYKDKIDNLIKTVEDNNIAEGERLQAFEALKAEYPTVFNNLLTEAEYLKDVLKYKKLIAEEDNNRARQDDTDLLTQEESKLEQLKLGIDKLKSIYGNDETHLKIKPSIDVYNAQLEVINKQKSKVASHDVTAFLGNIKDMKDGDIASVIDGINNSLKALGKSGDNAIAIVSELGGEFSKTQLSSIKNALETEQKSRSGDKKPGEEWLASYKKTYEDAEKAYNDFLNSKQVMSEAERDKELARLKELRDAAKTTYERKGGSASSDSKQQKESEKQKKEQEKLADELLTIRQQNQQDEITLMREGTDKKFKQIKLDYQKEIATIKKQENEWSKAQGGKLTQDQSIEISARYANAEDKRDKNIADTTEEQLRAEQQALNEYLEKYGTFQQQKYAIAQEYAEKIRKAQEESGADSAQVKLLQREQLEKTSAIDTAAIKANIDWATVFGEFGGMFNDMIRPALEEAKKYIKTDKFKNSDQASQKSLIDAINQMEKSLGGAGGVNFKELGRDLEAYQLAEKNRILAIENEKVALEELKKAQEDYTEVQKSGTEDEKKTAKDALDMAQNNADVASANVDTMTNIAIESQQNLSNTATNLQASMENVVGGLQQIASGGLYNAYSGAIKTINGFKDVMGQTSESLKEVPIVGWILSIIDVLKDGLSNLVGGLLDAILNAVSGILSDVLSGDLFVTIGESLISGIGNIFDAISFGGFSSLFGANGNAKEVNELVDKLTNSNRYLITAIDKLTGEMEKSGGAKATSLYTDAYEKEKQKIENDRLMLEAKMGYNASHHSNDYYINKAFNSDDWKKASDYVGKTLRNAGDLWKLSPEDLARLQELPDIWEKINKGKYDQSEWLDTYVDDAERLLELTTKWQETMTQVSFDSFYSSFFDTLMDMSSSSKDFADDFEEYLKKSILNSMLADNFQDDIEKLYESWSDAYKGDNEITEDEANALRDKQQKITEAMLAERDKLAEIFGWTKEDTDESVENYEDFASQMQGTLTSLELTAKGVSDNIYDYLRQAMIKALYEKEYKGKMEELYKSFEYLSADGLSESDMAQLGSQVDQYIEQMMKGVEDVNSLFADKLKDNEDLQSFVDNVKSAMSSIEATAEDVTDNIFEYIRQQMVEKMFADTFQPQIEEFYKKVQEAMADGDITDSERDALRSEAEKLANDIVAAKDILSDTLGITSKNLQKELEEEFKSFSDGILNSLYNAEVTAESVAKDIAESMRKELIEAMYIEQYEPRIKAIWEKWKEYSADGLVTDEERASIKADIDEIGKEVADAAKEISDAWKDSGEEVKKAFESFSDSIKSVLYGAEATAEDVANNIYQYMRNALVDSMFTAQLQPQIQAWYDKYTEFMKDGAIDTAERKTLDEMIAEIQKAGVDIVDAANALFPTLDTGAIKRAEEAAQEAENARNEAEQEWESFSDSILDSLYDIEATAEDISDDMSEYMRKALIKAMYVENFKPQMQKWYNEWQRAMGDDNLTSEEKQLLDSMKQTMVDDMKKEVDAINQFFGTMFSQQASSKGFEAMSQDTGEELNGRFTALNESSERIRAESAITNDWLVMIYGAMLGIDYTSPSLPLVSSDSDIKNSMLSVITSMNSLVVSSSDNNGVLNEIRNIMLLSNGYLEDISTYTKKILDEFSLRLSNIDRNTQNW